MLLDSKGSDSAWFKIKSLRSVTPSSCRHLKPCKMLENASYLSSKKAALPKPVRWIVFRNCLGMMQSVSTSRSAGPTLACQGTLAFRNGHAMTSSRLAASTAPLASLSL